MQFQAYTLAFSTYHILIIILILNDRLTTFVYSLVEPLDQAYHCIEFSVNVYYQFLKIAKY